VTIRSAHPAELISRWYERYTGHAIDDVQRLVRHWSLDGGHALGGLEAVPDAAG